MATRLHLIFPTTRPQFIGQITRVFVGEMAAHPFELRLHILVQGPEPDPFGTNKTNEAINYIRDGWLFMLSDDTIHHTDLFRRLHHEIKNHPDAGAIVFGCSVPGQTSGYPELPERIWNGSQVAWKRKFLGEHRYDFPKNGSMSDIILFHELYDNWPEKFLFVPDTLMRFNSLQQEAAA